MLITMSRRIAGNSSEDADVSGLLQPALTLVLTLMGDAGRTYNPHLRYCFRVTLPYITFYSMSESV